MRRMAFISALLMAATLYAAPHTSHGRHSFEATLGAGYASLGYPVTDLTDRLASKTIGSYGVQAHIGYNCFFSEYVGLAVGVDAHHYGQRTSLNGILSWNGVTDTDGERYEHILQLKPWTEHQDCWTIEIPLSLVFSIPVRNVLCITAQAGAKFALPLSATWNGHGTLVHSGYYEPWNLTLSDKPNHGFYTEQNFLPKGQWQSRNYWTLFAKTGVAMPLIEHLELLIQLYAHYALTPVGGESTGQPIGFRNDRPGQEQNHYFMTEYTPFLLSGVITGPSKPWDLGLEIGIRYTIAQRKTKYPCRCLGVR